MLLSEHRLIKRVIDMLTDERNNIILTHRTHIDLVYRGVDFFESYAIMTHQRKEEGILIEELRRKPLTREDLELLDELQEDHAFINRVLGDLRSARDAYLHDEVGTSELILVKLDELIGIYPIHFKKEEERLFPLVEEHFDEAEQQALMERFHQHDKERIHSMFEVVVSNLEKGLADRSEGN
jgi:hemerythrin-like domain-containing protein